MRRVPPSSFKGPATGAENQLGESQLELVQLLESPIGVELA